jgi:asparagine synthase (glutamine-hydrolysing)
MCGISGFLAAARGSDAEMTAVVRAMASTLATRGPDGSGEWVDAQSGIALGHRRLSIIDLSPAGAQPMLAPHGRYVVVFNGEIYNFRALRAELDGLDPARTWRGHSDTEVMLAAFEQWGLERTLQRLNGMFALALWDRAERKLHLARDRFGEKPLYYGTCRSGAGNVVLFGSELKAFAAHPAWRGDLDVGALRLYMQFNYVPAPHTIYTAARKVPAGSVITVSLDRAGTAIEIGKPREYWSALNTALAARDRPLTDRAAAKDELRELLGRAVSERSVADVPLGAFLSGGIDSSLIVALLQRSGGMPVRTFTIGFDDPRCDEAPYALGVAQHLGTDHTCHYVTPAEVRDVIMRMPALYDEPFADSSQIPTFLVAQIARRHVAVALTGDGGDELFGGYHRYFVGQRAFRYIKHVPHIARRALAALLQSVTPGTWESLLRHLRAIGPLNDVSGERLHRLASQLRAQTVPEMYEVLMSRPDSEVALASGARSASPFEDALCWPAELTDVEAMMLFDTLNVMADDFLVKVDRAAMGVSLETRAPLLDPALFELAWRMPMAWKVGAHSGKVLLRELLADFVPARLIDRPKQGFGIPVGPWLRGPLRDWAEALLDPQRLRAEGFLDAQRIREQWAQHLAGTHDRQNELWSALVFQEWLASQRKPVQRAPADVVDIVTAERGAANQPHYVDTRVCAPV